MIEDGTMDKFVADRYAGWETAAGKDILSGAATLDGLAESVEQNDINPEPVSGRQEYLENVVNRFV